MTKNGNLCGWFGLGMICVLFCSSLVFANPAQYQALLNDLDASMKIAAQTQEKLREIQTAVNEWNQACARDQGLCPQARHYESQYMPQIAQMNQTIAQQHEKQKQIQKIIDQMAAKDPQVRQLEQQRWSNIKK